jgi:protein-S-isoprenylcysteine O-methyltransferase Ste14
LNCSREARRHFIRPDERRLAERFGAAYLQYRSAVKRWIPALF